MATLVITARIEEVPTLGGFTLASLQRDLADFSGYKPGKYTAAFITDYQTAQTTVNAIINPKQLTAELKLITARIFENTNGLRQKIDLIEGYIADATGLSIGKKDFGISAVRKSINRDDQEALSGALAFLITNINNNLTPLTAQGYTTAQHTALTTAKSNLDNDNIAQNQKISARALLVTDNIDTINNFAQTMKDIWADGKRLYKTSSKTKLNDYTNAKLIERIRQESLRTKVTGTVTAADGSKLVEVKLKATKAEGGRSKTVRADKNGRYEFKGLKPVLLNITVTAKDKRPHLVQVTPITNETVTVDIVIP